MLQVVLHGEFNPWITNRTSSILANDERGYWHLGWRWVGVAVLNLWWCGGSRRQLLLCQLPRLVVHQNALPESEILEREKKKPGPARSEWQRVCRRSSDHGIRGSGCPPSPLGAATTAAASPGKDAVTSRDAGFPKRSGSRKRAAPRVGCSLVMSKSTL
jgi:hypothetical protein